MSIIIELTPEEETLLRVVAQKNGMDANAFAKEAVIRTARNEDEATRQRRERWQKWNNAGESATQSAWTELHSAGLGVVYAQPDGVVVEETPDGKVRPLADDENE